MYRNDPNLLWPYARRAFLRTSTMGLGSMALASLLNEGSVAYASGSYARPI